MVKQNSGKNVMPSLPRPHSQDTLTEKRLLPSVQSLLYYVELKSSLRTRLTYDTHARHMPQARRGVYCRVYCPPGLSALLTRIMDELLAIEPSEEEMFRLE